MKTLHIIRHAEATTDQSASTDSERPLTENGVKTARTVARRLHKAGFTADLMVSSPARRAMGTARAFAKALKYSVKLIDAQEILYQGATVESLSSLVSSLPDIASDVILVGHDPSFSDFTRHLIPAFGQPLPKCAVVTIALDTETWADAGPGCARLLRFDFPMSKREREMRIDAEVQALAGSLSSAMSQHLQSIDPRTAEALRAYTFKHHSPKKMRKIAKRFVELAPIAFE